VCNHKRIFPEIAHVLSEMKLEEVCHLCVHSLWGFLEVVRQFVVNFLIGEPFFCICEFYGSFFCEPIVLRFYVCCRFLIMHVRLVLEGGLANLHGMVRATCMRNMGVMVPFEVPSFASELAMSLPLTPM